MAPRLFEAATKAVPKQVRSLGDARRTAVKVMTTAESLPVVGRVVRPVSQLGMRFLFDNASGDWNEIRRDPTYADGFVEALRLLPKGFRPRQVLDAGCGTGLATGLMLDRWEGVRVTGVDIAPRMIEIAEQEYPKAAFFRASVHDLPFEDGRFDLIVLLDGMLDIPELMRVLHRKGRLLVVYSRGGTTPISRPVEQVAKAIEDTGGVATTHTDGIAHVVLGRHGR
jgi:SAM-dependent methyltransferase